MSQNSEYFCKLLSVDLDALSDSDRDFYESHRLGQRPELYGFTEQERRWLDAVVDPQNEGR
jgi:hypothetical protein